MSPAQKQTTGSHQFNIPTPESVRDNKRKDQKDHADAEYSDDPLCQTWNRKKGIESRPVSPAVMIRLSGIFMVSMSIKAIAVSTARNKNAISACQWIPQ